MRYLSVVLISFLALQGFGQQYSFESQRWCQGSDQLGVDCFIQYDFHTLTINPNTLRISGMTGKREFPLAEQLAYQETPEFYEVRYKSSMDTELLVRVYKADQEVEGYVYRSELIIREYSVSSKYYVGGDIIQ